MRRLHSALFFALLVGAPLEASSQERQCDIDAPGRTENVGSQLIMLYDPFTVVCDDGAELRANEGQLNQLERELLLVGNVFFEDAGRTLTSDRATYNSETGRLYATGQVEFVNLEEGSTLRGPELEYFRANEDRPLAQVLATQRPTLTMAPELGREDEEPMELVADRVMIIGEDDLSAFGRVVITRSDLDAAAEEARYNTTTEDLELRREARIVNEDYALAAEVIQAQITEGSLEHVHARTDAELNGEDLFVSAPDLQMFFAADSLRRAVARAPRDPASQGGRAVARARDFELEGDSIDATLQDQQLREVVVIGSARAESVPQAADSLARAVADSAALSDPALPPAAGPDLFDAADSTEVAAPDPATSSLPLVAGSAAVPPAPAIAANDWVRGDTIIGYFEPVVAPDTAVAVLEPARAAVDPADDPAVSPLPPDSLAGRGTPEGAQVELRRLVAIGSAQSLYRMTAEGADENARKNINFLVGDRIELDLVDGELEVARVDGLQRGMFLEATQPGAAPPPAPAPGEPVPEISIPATGDV